ncbi:unnamed protein product, partial [Amoebophrya sp. A120]
LHQSTAKAFAFFFLRKNLNHNQAQIHISEGKNTNTFGSCWPQHRSCKNKESGELCTPDRSPGTVPVVE